MNEQDPTGQEGHEKHAMDDWETQINAMLDDELDDRQAEALKSAAERDRELARAIIEAYQLQRLMANLPREQAPASLRRKLRAIPGDAARIREARGAGRRGGWLDWLRQPRWVATAAVVCLVPVFVLLLVDSGPGPGEQAPPSQAEIAQARQDLALALAYLERAGRATERRIDRHIDRRMAAPVTEEMVRAIEEPFDLGGKNQGENHPFQDQEQQEREA